MTTQTESSTSQNLATRMGNTTDLAALQGFGGKPPPLIDRSKRKRKKKKLSEAKLFEADCVFEALQTEVVRKRGNQWVLFDDHTGVELGTFKNRKAAWENQRARRTQAKALRHAKSQKKQKAKATNKVAPKNTVGKSIPAATKVATSRKPTVPGMKQSRGTKPTIRPKTTFGSQTKRKK